MMLRRKDWLGAAGSYFLVMVLGLSRLMAQTPSDRNVPYQRIFIPRSELSSLTPKDFVPVKIAELEQLLPRGISPPDMTLAPSEPQITQLLLVASLVGEDLVSDVSRMVVQYDEDVRATLDATPLSLAMRSPASAQSLKTRWVWEMP